VSLSGAPAGPGSQGLGIVPVALSDQDAAALAEAVMCLERPSLVARVSDLAGTPIEALVDRLPAGVGERVSVITHKALEGALRVAVATLGRRAPGLRSRNRLHAAAAGVTGVFGGAFGLASLAFELPVTTTIILRSVADIARSEGEDLGSVAARLSCLEVFALGGRGSLDDAAESGYFALRAALATAVSEASRYLAGRVTVSEGAPVIARLLAQIGTRFNAVVAEKIVAEGVPVVGALGGAVVNMLFIRHFQGVARGHFTVRRLECAYGADVVRESYERLRLDLGR
jgi:hypothetical protein